MEIDSTPSSPRERRVRLLIGLGVSASLTLTAVASRASLPGWATWLAFGLAALCVVIAVVRWRRDGLLLEG